MKSLSQSLRVALFAGLLAAPVLVSAQPVFDPAFSAAYTLTNIFGLPGVPTPYGAATFKASDPDTLLVGGLANTESAGVFAVKVIRDDRKHIIGFEDSTTRFANAPGISPGSGLDGGLAYGPSNVLFYTSYPENSLGQIKPGETNPAVQIALASVGIGSGFGGSVGSLTFVPPGFSGEGRLKVLNYDQSTWYDTTVTPGTNGVFTINPPTKSIVLPNVGIEGAIYISGGNPGFTKDTVLISENNAGEIAAYDVDGNGDPILETRRTFVTNLSGAEGAAIDPLTGDFLFTSFGNGNQIVIVSGFTVNPSNIRPTVRITAPTDQATIKAGVNLTLVAEASDTDGQVVSVEFLNGANSLGVVTNAPYQITIPNIAVGNYSFTARAVDNDNGRAISTPVRVIVTNPNNLPTATLVGVTNNTTLAACSDLELKATAADSDGTIASVEYFYGGNIKIGSATAAPYQLIWMNVPVGSHSITAQAIDNGGGRGTSAPVNITVTGLAANTLKGAVLSDRSFMVCLGTQTNGVYQIQAATNVAGTWTTLTNVSVGTNLITRYTDTEAAKLRYRFYKATKQ